VSRAIAVGFIAAITFINYRGVKLAAGVQNLFTVLKLAGIAVLVFAAFISRQPSQLHLSWSAADFAPKQLGLALAAALVAYEGWNNLSFVNGEIVNPQRNAPLALGFGVLTSVLAYVLLTAAYLRVLPVGVVAASPRVGGDVAARLFGSGGAVFLSIIILVSIVGSATLGGLRRCRPEWRPAAPYC